MTGYQPTSGPRNPRPATGPRRSIEQDWADYKASTPPELRDGPEPGEPGDLLWTPTPGQKVTA